MLSLGCSTARQASTPSQTESYALKLRCLVYHHEHHHEDEEARQCTGLVEFTGYRISILQAEAGEALVGIKVVSHKNLQNKWLYVGDGQDIQLESEERDVDWQERWHKTKDGWAFVERVGVVFPSSWIIKRESETNGTSSVAGSAR